MSASEKDPLVKSEAGYGSADVTEEYSSTAPLLTRVKETMALFWYLGFVAFGGPTAHVAIFRDHLVGVHNFMDEDVYTELFALGKSIVEIFYFKLPQPSHRLSDCALITLFPCQKQLRDFRVHPQRSFLLRVLPLTVGLFRE